MKMKKNNRIGALVDILTSNPCKLFDLMYFCERFGAAKSSLSEDIKLVNEVFISNGSGRIESSSGVGGGIRYVPGISDERVVELQRDLCEKLSDSSRILGGGFIYTSDIMYDGHIMDAMARVFVREFYKKSADYVVTVETKGIPIAAKTAALLNLPLVIIRREAKYAEGTTVSINYFSGSSDRIQKMSISKRAVKPGSKAIVVDDFMRAGGTLKGIEEILAEFDIEVVGKGAAIALSIPTTKRVFDCIPIMYLDSIDEENREIILHGNEDLIRG